MNAPVVVIGLDSFDPALCEAWLEAGHLPHLRRLRDRGAWGRLNSTDSETAWTTVPTGVEPKKKKTGFRSHFSFDPRDYRCAMPGTYDFERYPPFYAIGDEYRVAAIDVPQVRLADRVNGVQILAYGAHAPFTDRVSRPADLLSRLIETYGDHPAANGTDYARFWRRSSMDDLVRRLHVGAERRGAICRDLLRAERWDLFLAIFGEIHSVCHYLWHTAQPSHPLYEQFRDTFDSDQMLAVANSVDSAVGELLTAAPANARIVVFSQEGMVANAGDMPGALYLPELLYRHSFPDRRGIDPDPSARAGQNEPLPPPILHPHSRAWHREAWAFKHDDNGLRRFLRRNLPIELGWLVEKVMGSPPGPGHPLEFDVKYQPAVWYSPYWPSMKAFALPSASQQGKVRINLSGREADGVVQPGDYEAVCAEITGHLLALRNVRTGDPLVREVVPPGSGADADPGGAFADLVVHWDSEPTDIIDSPTYGRFGPVQYMRTGGARREGLRGGCGTGHHAGLEVGGGACARSGADDSQPRRRTAAQPSPRPIHAAFPGSRPSKRFRSTSEHLRNRVVLAVPRLGLKPRLGRMVVGAIRRRGWGAPEKMRRISDAGPVDLGWKCMAIEAVRAAATLEPRVGCSERERSLTASDAGTLVRRRMGCGIVSRRHVP